MPRTRTEWLHWFRVDCDLESHPRLLQLAQQIKTDPERALGRIVRFMSWVARHAPRGVLPVGWEVGVSRLYGQGFPDALRRVGWVEKTEEGDKFRRWWELNGHLLRDRERKRRGDSAEVPGTFPPVSGPTRAQATSTATSTAKARPDAVPSLRSGTLSRDTPAPEEPGPGNGQQISLVGIVKGIAKGKALKPPPAPDWRPRAWDDARAASMDVDEAARLMELAGWLRKRGVYDPVIHARVFRVVVDSAIKNPMAYFTRDGAALQALVGEHAVEIAEAEQKQHQLDDEAADLGRKS
jgi:hypothetical protein